MFNAIRNRMEKEEGFTLIELLVVILIIGILAAIAIPSFLNQRYKGQDACAKSMAKQMQTAAETYQTDNNAYTGLTLAGLNQIETSVVTTSSDGCYASSVTGGACTGSPAATAYCVTATSASTNTFSIANNGGVVTRSCTRPSGTANAGGCKISGSATSGSW